MDPDNLLLQARDVEFDFSSVPLHWVPGDPFSTHFVNVMHLLLPEAERWFVALFTEALPMITDDKVRADMHGFIGQESMHAEAHQGAANRMAELGLDPAPFAAQMEWVFRTLLGPRGLRGKAGRAWLVDRLAIVAAMEHLTALLGHWILNARGLDRAGADPVMMDLLRWHGAEEVEHRSVAFDVYSHVDGRISRRIAALAVIGPAMALVWIRGLRFLVANDPELACRKRKPGLRNYRAAARKDRLPGRLMFARQMASFLRRGYHPEQEFSTEQAVGYLATSPAARAAGH